MKHWKIFYGESKLTLRLAIPMIAGQMSQMLMGLVDTLMVGYIGVVELAAVAFANSLLMVPLIFGIGLLHCIPVRVAQAHGRGKKKEIAEVLRHGMLLSVVAGVILLGVVVLVSFRLHWFGQPVEVVKASRTFLILVGISILPMLMGMSLKQFSEALDHPWPPTWIMLGSVGLNAVLNWVLIYGNLGFRPMGLEGAGWATLIARVVCVVVLFWYVLKAERFKGAVPLRWRAALHWASLRGLLVIGIPASLHLLLEAGAFAGISIMMGWIDTVSLAAHQITLSCAGTTYMIPLGIAMAVTIRVSQKMGADKVKRVRIAGTSGFIMAVTVMCCSATLFGFGGQFIAGWFTNDYEVIKLAGALFVVAGIFQIFDGVQVVAAGALRGMNDVNIPVVYTFFSYWVVGLTLAYWLCFSLGWGGVAIWIGLAVALAIASVLLVTRFWALTGVFRKK